MINIKSYVTVSPRIVRSHTRALITVSAKFDFISFEGEYEIAVLPKYYYESGDRLAEYSVFYRDAEGGEIKFEYDFAREQEYCLKIKKRGECGGHDKAVELSLYALDEDLFGLYAVKGDLHMHTNCSDGLESVDHRLAAARMAGMDMLAITDHNGYAGSVRAAELVKRCSINMVALYGEEVHADFCPVHILSLGSREAIAPKVQRRSDGDKLHMRDIAEEYSSRLADDVDKRSFSSAMDVFEKIRAAGGMSVLCHIYWDAINAGANARFGAPQQLVDALVEAGKFDAFEITSGAPASDTQANYMQPLYYRENLPQGFPVIGITDSHTSDAALGSIFGKNYTVVLVKEFSQKGIIDAILAGNSVAVDGVQLNPICHGSLRLSKYVTFLIQNYFPVHDSAVRTEGEIMERVLLAKIGLDTLAEVSAGSMAMLEGEWGNILPKA